MASMRVQWITGVFLLAGLFLTAWIYWPGLSGPFIFDDYANLRALGTDGSVDNWQSFKNFVFSGFAGPTGRPLSLLTFLIDTNTWPADPASFKYTNLCIHLINGCLVFLVSMSLLRIHGGQNDRCQQESRVLICALISTLVWLLHPYLVSTTLYAVQRMAQLPMTFCLTGLYIWLKARPHVDTRPLFAYGWMTVSLTVPGILAVLSKENGALLPVFIWVIEATVIRASGYVGLNATWKRLFLVLPTLAILTYLVFLATSNGWFQAYHDRNFSPFERLLTQSRLLFSYLYHWFVPHMHTTGVFHDQIPISRSFFSPWTTALSVTGIAAILLLSLKKSWQIRFPLLTLALLFFLTSHLIESTVVGLELRFEHRMYIASAFLVLPVLHGAFQYYRTSIVLAVAVTFLVLLASFCRANAKLWSNYEDMVQVWAIEAPDSGRAQVELAKMYYDAGLKRQSLQVLEDSSDNIQDDLFLHLTYLQVRCEIKGVSDELKENIVEIAKVSEYRSTWIKLMTNFLKKASGKECPNVGIPYFLDVVNILLEKESNPEKLSYAQLTYFNGVGELLSGDDKVARKYFQRSVNSRAGPQKLMNIASYLATEGRHHKALVYANFAKERIKTGKLTGRQLATKPTMNEINMFIKTVKKQTRESKQ